MKLRGIRSIAPLSHNQMNANFWTHSVREQFAEITHPVPLNPFLSLDHFHMLQPTFRAHPHAGFSAVTYMFEDSQGSFLNRDSLGDSSRIDPGDLHWTQAGSGVLHEEVPEVPGKDCHGLQMFVTLSEDHELQPPRMFHVSSKDVPEVTKSDGVRIRVVCGESNGKVSPLQGLSTPITLLDVHLAPGATMTHTLPTDHFAMALMIQGEAQTTSNDDTCTLIGSNHAVAFDEEGEAIQLSATSSEKAQFLLAASHNVKRAGNFWNGPFCLSSPDKAKEAMERFRAGGMGHLSSSF